MGKKGLLFGGLILLLSVLVHAALKPSLFYRWTPKMFTVTTEAAEASYSQLLASDDPALREILNFHPNFKENFFKDYVHLFEVALQNILMPWDLRFAVNPDENDDGIEDHDSAEEISRKRIYQVSYRISKNIKNIELFVFNNLQKRTLGDEETGKNLKYRYCELHPNNKIAECGPNSSTGSLAWVFARRLISNPVFVEKMCPVITPFAVWFINWSWGHDVDLKTEYYSDFMAELERVLDFYYADGEWTHSRIPKPEDMDRFTSLDGNMAYEIYRRYLDGGPELMLAYQKCVNQIDDAFSVQSYGNGDEKAAQEIQKILKFRELQMPKNGEEPGPVLEVESNAFGLDVAYRLIRNLSMETELPQYVYFTTDTDDIPYDSPEFLNTISGLPREGYLWDSHILRILHHMNRLDSQYNYRLITEAEFQALVETDEKLADMPEVCMTVDKIHSGSEVENTEFRYHNKIDDCYEPTGGCPPASLLIVREKGASNKFLSTVR